MIWITSAASMKRRGGFFAPDLLEFALELQRAERFGRRVTTETFHQWLHILWGDPFFLCPTPSFAVGLGALPDLDGGIVQSPV